jgi:hypothetical protein
MTRKFPFKFDFNEDADPVDELHRLRVATTKHFKTLDALVEYYRSTPSIKELIAEIDAEITGEKAETLHSKKRKTASSKAPMIRGKAARRPLAHA